MKHFWNGSGPSCLLFLCVVAGLWWSIPVASDKPCGVFSWYPDKRYPLSSIYGRHVESSPQVVGHFSVQLLLGRRSVQDTQEILVKYLLQEAAQGGADTIVVSQSLVTPPTQTWSFKPRTQIIKGFASVSSAEETK